MEMQLDQFYTKDSVAKDLTKEYTNILTKIGYSFDNILFIEPSAGYGCFLRSVEEEGLNIRAFDIEPKNKDVKKKDFLKENIKINGEGDCVIIGNPPFGKKGGTAIKFIIKSLEYTDTIGFILPNTFTKYLTQKALPNDLKLVLTYKVQKNAFYTEKGDFDVNCVFQVWTKRDSDINDKRIKKQPPITHKDFILYQYNNTKQALKYFNYDWDIAIFNQGYGEYPNFKYRSIDCNKRKQWLFVKVSSQKVLSNIKKIDFDLLANGNTTIKGFRKADFVKEYQRLYG